MRQELQQSGLGKKIVYVGCVFVLFYVIVLARAYHLLILGNTRLNSLASSQHKTHILVQPKRGTIYDRNGEPLAMDVRVSSVAIHPRQLDASEKPVLQELLKKNTSLTSTEINKKINSKKRFEWIERRIPLASGNAIAEKKIKGVQIIDEFRRYYPNKQLAGQLLGAVGYDATALGGVEMQYDRYLKTGPKKVQIERDARGQFFRIRNETENSNDLYLTVDINIQLFAERALTDMALKHNVKNGYAIVMDVKTGELLALANYPSFNPNLYWRYDQEYWKNHAAIDVFEPGSTFKTILMAAALGSGKVRATDRFFCENGSLRIGKNTISDHGAGYGLLSAKQILQVSSNIGVTKIAQTIGKKTFYDFIRTMGFGEVTGVGIAGEGRGSVRDWRTWMDIEFSNIAFGQGISVTGLQMASAYNAIANDGEYISPQLVTKVLNSKNQVVYAPERQSNRQVLEPGAARDLRDMLHAVTQPGGTAVTAHVKGYLSGGKTGTAQKVDPATRSYASNQYVSSFVGFSPLDDPQVVVFVVFDTPRANGYYGGVVAGPVFRTIVENTMGYLGIPPRFAEPETQLAESKRQAKPDAIPLAKSGATKPETSYEAAASQLMQSRMPDLKGFSLRAVMRLAHENRARLKVDGSGFVADQRPRAGERVGRDWRVSLAGL